MSTFLYSGPAGDQYEAWKKEYLAEQEAAKEVEVVEEAPKKAPVKKTASSK